MLYRLWDGERKIPPQVTHSGALNVIDIGPIYWRIRVKFMNPDKLSCLLDRLKVESVPIDDGITLQN